MIPILYESTETSFSTNGICRLPDCLSCVVTEERNGIYECDFEYPVNGAYYDQIECGRIIGVIHEDSNDLQPFDIVSYSRPINGIVNFHAVHISYRQTEMVAVGTNISSLANALAMLKNASPSNPFTYETDITSSAYMAAADGIPRSVRQMLGGVEGSILDSYGGEYEWDKWTVNLWKQRGVVRDITIRYGINLTDYNEDLDYFGTYTSAIPYWKGNDSENGEVIVVGDKVDSGLDSYAGREICVPLDLTDKFSEKPTKAQLQAFALSQMNSNDVNLPKQSINVDFVNLKGNELSDVEQLMECKLCDQIRVVFPRYNMTGYFKIVKTTFDVLAGRFTDFELGSLSTSLSEAMGITSGRDSTNPLATDSTSSTGTYGTLNARRIAGMVFVWFNGASASMTRGQWVTVGTLPEGYRPVDNINGMGVNNAVTSSSSAPLMYRINSSGVVAVWAYSGTGNVQAMFNCSFIK